MIERTERDLDSSQNVSPPTRTAPASSSAGSSAPASGRKSLSGTRVLVTTAPSRVPTSRSIRNAMSMSVPRATCSRPPAASAPCCPKTPSRKVTRDVNEDARDQARSQMGTPEFDRSRDERKKVEMRFAHLKTHHRFERMRLRGLSGARDEFHLAAIVQNLKTLASHVWRPPPNLPAGHFA